MDKHILSLNEIIRASGKVSTFIHEKFADKVDKAGNDYTDHLETVAENAMWNCDDDEHSQYTVMGCFIVGMCHDLFEDTDCSEEELRKVVDDDNIIEAIHICTRGKNETYKDFIKRIHNSGSEMAKYVKVADLEHNMDIKRLPEIEDKDLKRLKKYFYSWKYLNDEISEEEYDDKV